jgi:hypothetical protein
VLPELLVRIGWRRVINPSTGTFDRKLWLNLIIVANPEISGWISVPALLLEGSNESCHKFAKIKNLHVFYRLGKVTQRRSAHVCKPAGGI